MKKELWILIIILAAVAALIFYKFALTGEVVGDGEVPVCPDGETWSQEQGRCIPYCESSGEGCPPGLLCTSDSDCKECESCNPETGFCQPQCGTNQECVNNQCKNICIPEKSCIELCKGKTGKVEDSCDNECDCGCGGAEIAYNSIKDNLGGLA